MYVEDQFNLSEEQYMDISGTAVDQEKVLSLLPQFDEYANDVIGVSLENQKWVRRGLSWNYLDNGTLEFTVRYVSDTGQTE